MYQVKGLTVTHKKDLTTLVDALSFTLEAGVSATTPKQYEDLL